MNTSSLITDRNVSCTIESRKRLGHVDPDVFYSLKDKIPLLICTSLCMSNPTQVFTVYRLCRMGLMALTLVTGEQGQLRRQINIQEHPRKWGHGRWGGGGGWGRWRRGCGVGGGGVAHPAAHMSSKCRCLMASADRQEGSSGSMTGCDQRTSWKVKWQAV